MVGIYNVYFIGKIIITLSERIESAAPMIVFFTSWLSVYSSFSTPVDRKFSLAKPNETASFL